MRAARYIGGAVHPLITGLIGALPELDEPLDAKRRADWLDAADKVLRLLYADPAALTPPFPAFCSCRAASLTTAGALRVSATSAG